MIRKLLGVALTLALPAVLSAQAPEATAKPAVTHGKATRRLGEVVRAAEPTEDKDHDLDDRKKGGDKDGDDHTRNPNAATPADPATRATPAVPVKGEGPATPAKPATPATPAVPAHKSGGHKP